MLPDLRSVNNLARTSWHMYANLIRHLLRRGLAASHNRRFRSIVHHAVVVSDDILEELFAMDVKQAGEVAKVADKVGVTPLHTAALLGNCRAVETLLAHGADVDAGDLLGNTALHYAASGRCPDTANQILLAGADKYAEGSLQRTPMDVAILVGGIDVVAVLMSHDVLNVAGWENLGSIDDNVVEMLMRDAEVEWNGRRDREFDSSLR